MILKMKVIQKMKHYITNNNKLKKIKILIIWYNKMKLIMKYNLKCGRRKIFNIILILNYINKLKMKTNDVYIM